MSKLMYVNANDYAIVAGSVVSVKDTEDFYAVRLSYRVNQKDSAGNWETADKTVDIYVRNQDIEGGVPYADRVRAMNLTVGSNVLANIRFSDSERKNANGYAFKYDGVMSITNGSLVKEVPNGRQRVKPTSDEERNELLANGYAQERYYVVKGLITTLRKKKNSLGEDYLSLTVYTGKDKDGNFKSEMIQIKNSDRNRNILANAEKVLAPRSDGTKTAAAFLCGSPYRTLVENDEGLAEIAIYTAFDFSKTGIKAAKTAQAS